MPSVLALDQGTTGSTALLVHQDGSVLGRAYREFDQHYPQPGWVEHDPDQIFESRSRSCARRWPALGSVL
jgi:glycerol kinase